MNIKLQKPIETYFNTSNNPDPKKFISIFAEDAIVIDEGQEYVGLDKIQEWSTHHHFAAKLELEIINVIEKNLITVVTAKVDGDFDKTGLPDPLLLDFHFTILKGMVAELEILFPKNI
ncbi:nuclear transport factor 2 family protein [Clostridium chromiireducens]|uniref:nuclear transport factor 2 family protein n=1 Tax=Clostridium chromiireducens TaxID=225345 RepID=UPI003AF792AC